MVERAGTIVPSPAVRPDRIPQLDVLRGVSILLVLGRHLGYFSVWQRVGWLGVQLFFVLSGFLVSGLLFSEYRRHGSLDLRRFYLRRGLKIYPPFLALLLVTLAFDFWRGIPIPRRTVWSELFVLQNYGQPLWDHEWSLAVEEHFYLLLPLLLVFARWRGSSSSNPYVRLPYWVGAIGVTILGLRLVTGAYLPFDRHDDLYPTHLRADALAFGVLLAYWHHFHGEWLGKSIRRHRTGLTLAAGLLLAPFLVLDLDQFVTRTVGLTWSYLGLGGVMLVAVYGRQPESTGAVPASTGLGRILGPIGRSSYGIYLWHLPVRDWLIAKAHALGWLRPGSGMEFLVYAGMSLAVGILATHLVELPILMWRERRVPSRGRSLITSLHEA